MADVYLTRFEFVASGLSKVTSEFTNVANGMKAKASSAGKLIGLGLTGGILAGFGANAIAAALGTKAFANYEQGLASVSKTTGLAGEDLDMLGSKLRELAVQGPVTVAELENIAAVAGSLGIGAAKMNVGDMAGASDEIAHFTQLMSDMSVAFEMDPTIVSEQMAAIGNVYKIPVEEMDVLGSQINALENSMRATAPGIIEWMNNFGGTASLFDESAAKTAAFGAVLSEVGINAPEAATQIRSGVLQLTQATNVSEAKIKKYAKDMGISIEEATTHFGSGQENMAKMADLMGISTEELANKIDTDLYGTLIEMGAVLKEIPGDTERAAVAQKIFGAYGYAALVKAGGAADIYDTALGHLNVTGEELSKESAIMANTLLGQWQRLKNGLNDIGISIGQVTSGPIKDFISYMNESVIPGVKNFIESFVSGDWGKVKEIITSSFNFEAVKPLIDNFGALIVTSFIVLKTNLIGILAGLVSTVVSAFISMAAKSVAALAPMVARVAMVFANMARAALTQVATMAGRVILAFIGMASKSVASLILMGSQVAATFLGMATTALIHVASLVAGVVTATATMASKVLANVARMAAGVIATFIAMASPILLPLALVAAAIAGIGLAAGAIPGVGAKFKEFGGKAVAALKDVWSSISAGNYSEAFDKIKNYVKNAFESIKSYFKSADLKKDVQKLFDGLKIAFMKGVEVIVEQAKNLGEKLKVALTEAIKNAVGEAKFEELSEKFNEVKDKIIETVESIKEPFEGVWTSLKEKAKSAIEDIKSAFGPAFDEIKQTVETVKTAISNLFDENEGKAQQWISTLSQIIAKFVEWGGSAVIGMVKLQLEFVAKVLETVFMVINDYLIPGFTKLFDYLKPAIDGVIEGFKWFYNKIVDVIKIGVEMHDKYGRIFTGILALIVDWVNGAYAAFKEFATSTLAIIIKWGSDLGASIKSSLGSAGLSIITFVENAGTAVRQLIGNFKELIGLQDKASGGAGVGPYEGTKKVSYTTPEGKMTQDLGYVGYQQAVKDFGRFGPVTAKSVFGQQSTGSFSLGGNDFENFLVATMLQKGGTVQTSAWHNFFTDPTVRLEDGTEIIMGDDPYGTNQRDLEERGVYVTDPETGKQKVDWENAQKVQEETANNTSTTNSILEGLKQTFAGWESATPMSEEEARVKAEGYLKFLPDELIKWKPEEKQLIKETAEGTQVIVDLNKEQIDISDLSYQELQQVKEEIANLEDVPDLTEDQSKVIEDVGNKVSEEIAKTKGEQDKESYEKTKDSLEDPRFYSSFYGNSLDYIKQIKELAAVGMAHPAQITHAAMLSEKISNDLMRAYEVLGTIPNEYVAQIVGLDTSQLGPVPIDTVAESIDVPKTETVDVNAEVTGESKTLLATEISSVDPTIITNTDVDQQSLAATVGNIEAQKPNVGVSLYIAQNITIPKTVNIGVNFYPLNSPTANVPSSTDKSLQKFDSGGYTGRYSGPAWVDPEEVILNKAQQLGVIKSLAGNNKGSGEVHVHYDLRNTIITGFKDVDDFISYSTEKTIKEINRRQGTI